MSSLIFRTIHGSTLYGLDHEESDIDIYEVYQGDGNRLTHTVTRETDTVRGSLRSFIVRAVSGSHQSAEALFSSLKEWAPGMEEKYGPYLSGFRISGGDVFAKYERTIKALCYGDFKKRRHAVRLYLNLRDLRRFGRFDPTLTPEEVKYATELARVVEGLSLRKVLNV